MQDLTFLYMFCNIFNILQLLETTGYSIVHLNYIFLYLKTFFKINLKPNIFPDFSSTMVYKGKQFCSSTIFLCSVKT